MDFPRQWHLQRDSLMPIIERTLAQGDLIMRQQLVDFEAHLAAFVGVAHAVGVSNCTDGLRLLAHALDVGPGGEVLTVSHTFVASISPFALRGATPILVDIGEDHLMDPGALAELLGGQPPAGGASSRLVVPVHLNGRACDMAAICQAAGDAGAIVIEDAAQALGAKVGGRSAGAFGLASAFSFYPAKILGALGDGGAVLTDDAELAGRLRSLRDHGRVTKTTLEGWGYNCRLDNLQAAVLDWRLTQLPKWINRRRSLARRYDEQLAGVPGLTIPAGPDAGAGRLDVYQNYVVSVDGRDDLVARLAERGIETLVSWPVPLHHQPGLGLDGWSLPATEFASDHVVSLPMHVQLDDWQVDYVCDQLKEFLGGKP